MVASGGARSLPLPQEVVPFLTGSVNSAWGLLAGLTGRIKHRDGTDQISKVLCHPRALSFCSSFWNTGAGPYSEEFVVQ